jgi:hypothetical protein
MLFYDVIYFFLSKDTTRLLVRDGSTIETAQCTLLSLPLSSAGSLPSGLHADLNSGALHSLAAASQPALPTKHPSARAHTHANVCVTMRSNPFNVRARAPISQPSAPEQKKAPRPRTHPPIPLPTRNWMQLQIEREIMQRMETSVSHFK